MIAQLAGIAPAVSSARRPQADGPAPAAQPEGASIADLAHGSISSAEHTRGRRRRPDDSSLRASIGSLGGGQALAGADSEEQHGGSYGGASPGGRRQGPRAQAGRLAPGSLPPSVRALAGAGGGSDWRGPPSPAGRQQATRPVPSAKIGGGSLDSSVAALSGGGCTRGGESWSLTPGRAPVAGQGGGRSGSQGPLRLATIATLAGHGDGGDGGPGRRSMTSCSKGPRHSSSLGGSLASLGGGLATAPLVPGLGGAAARQAHARRVAAANVLRNPLGSDLRAAVHPSREQRLWANRTWQGESPGAFSLARAAEPLTSPPQE